MAPDDPRLLADALGSLTEGVQLLSPEWRYLYVNAAAARQGRKESGELLGRTMLECYPGIEKTPMFAVLERCLREQRSETLENEFTYDDGQRAWFELRVHPSPRGLTILSLDMTRRKNTELELRDAYQQALRDLVTPVVRVADRVLLVPLIGPWDNERALHMNETLLARAVEDRARVVILDVAGVPSLDTAVAKNLLDLASMVRLLGARTILTGLSPAAAKTIVHLGVDLSAMSTTSQLAEGIELAREYAARAR